jgi:peptidoglycan/LPS O-acetylase OafA/YrhL
MKNDCLTRSECAALRGMAIMAIMLHNYCHWFSFAIKENEYTYHSYYNYFLWNHVFNLNKNVIFDLFSFFGHYGVPVFLFISGYGLVMKYEKEDVDPPTSHFIVYHYLKLLRLMAIGVVAFIAVDFILQNEFRFTIMRIIGQFTMLINFSPNPDKVIKPGPYWYFGLMLQLYVIYKLLLYRRHWSYTIILIAICWAVQALCSPTGDTLNWLRYNSIGAIMPFGIGILYARFGKNVNTVTHIIIFCASISAIYFFGTSYQLWLWIPLFIVMGSVSLIKITPSLLVKPLAWIGGISSSIFVIHPIIRPIIIKYANNENHIYVYLIIYTLASIAIAYLYSMLLKYIPKPKFQQ